MALSFWEMLFGGTVTLQTDLGVSDASARLKAITDESWTFSNRMFSTQKQLPVTGSVNGNEFSWYKQTSYRNDLRTKLSGKLDRGAAGATIITCRFGLSPVVWIVLCWMGIIFSIMAYASIFADYAGIEGIRDPIEGAKPIVAILLAFIGFFTFLRFLARGEQRFMLALVKETLGARETSSARDPGDNKSPMNPKDRQATVDR